MEKKSFGQIINEILTILKNALLHFKTNNPVGMAGTTAYFTIFFSGKIFNRIYYREKSVGSYLWCGKFVDYFTFMGIFCLPDFLFWC